MRTKDAVGRYGEELAARHLASAGLTVIDRNWRCAAGELDLVAREGTTIVFVEVKTRSTTAFGDPAEAITPVKAARIHRLGLRWLEAHRDVYGWPDMRFDVISIVRLAEDGPSVRHLQGVF